MDKVLNTKLKRTISQSKTGFDPLRIPVVKPIIQDTIKSGYLYKQGQLNTNFKKRYFILSHKHLYYYKSPTDAKFTGVIQLLFSSFRIVTQNELDTLGIKTHSHTFKIMTPDRIFYLHGETKEEVQSWIDSLSKVCVKLWEEENSIAKDPKFAYNPDLKVLKEGMLLKQGNNMLKDWKHRWFVLKKDYIAYFKSPEDKTPLGTIPLLQCSVKQSTSISKKFCIEFITPSRTFYAVANTSEDLKSWMEAIQIAITKTLERFFESNTQGNTKKSVVEDELGSSRSRVSYRVNADLLASSFKKATDFEEPNEEEEDLKTINRLLKELTDEAESLREEDEEITQMSDKAVSNDILNRLLSYSENRVCAECFDPDPKWASINIGIFVCIECSGIHRSLGVQISKVRSVDLDDWDSSTLEFMEQMGNKKARTIWEFSVPSTFERPNPKSARTAKSAWIQAKYVYRKFADPDIIKSRETEFKELKQNEMQAVTTKGIPVKEGFLTKQGPKQEIIRSWRKRWFILKVPSLYYYITREDEIPAGSIPLQGAKVRVASNPGRNHCFEIVTEGRDYVLSAEDSVEMFSWMSSIKDAITFVDRRSQLEPNLNLSNIDHYIVSNPMVENAIKRKSMILNEKFIKKRGYLLKKGNNMIKDWKQRYCVLYKNYLYYYESNRDYLPLGIIELQQCSVQCTHATPKRFIFDLITETRTYYFCAQSQSDMDSWVEMIRIEINSIANPETPGSITSSPTNSINLSQIKFNTGFSLNDPNRKMPARTSTVLPQQRDNRSTITRPASELSVNVPNRDKRSDSKPLPVTPRDRAASNLPPLPPTPNNGTANRRPGAATTNSNRFSRQ